MSKSMTRKCSLRSIVMQNSNFYNLFAMITTLRLGEIPVCIAWQIVILRNLLNFFIIFDSRDNRLSTRKLILEWNDNSIFTTFVSHDVWCSVVSLGEFIAFLFAVKNISIPFFFSKFPIGTSLGGDTSKLSNLLQINFHSRPQFDTYCVLHAIIHKFSQKTLIASQWHRLNQITGS